MHKADNLTIFICWLSLNFGTSTSWNPQGLSSPVEGLLYLTKHTLLFFSCFMWTAIMFSKFCSVVTKVITSLISTLTMKCVWSDGGRLFGVWILIFLLTRYIAGIKTFNTWQCRHTPQHKNCLMYLFIACTCFTITNHWHLMCMSIVNADQIENPVSRNLKFCKIVNTCTVRKFFTL